MTRSIRLLARGQMFLFRRIAFLFTVALVAACASPAFATTLKRKPAAAGSQTFAVSIGCSGTGQTCDVPFIATVSTGRDVDVVFTTSPGHCSNIDVDVRIDGELAGNTGILGPGQSSPVIHAGPVAPGKHEIRLIAHGHEGGCNDGTLVSWAGTLAVDTSPITEPALTYFNERGEERGLVEEGEPITYRGTGFDESAEEISVLLDGQLVQVFPAASEINGTAVLTEFGDGQCTSELRAVQRDSGGAVVLRKTIDVTGDPIVNIRFVHNEVRIADVLVQTGDKICDDDIIGTEPNLSVTRNAAVVMQFRQTGEAMFVLNNARGIHFPDAGLLTPELRMAVGPGVLGLVRNGPVSVTEFDPCHGTPEDCGGTNIIRESQLSNSTLEGINRTRSSLSVNGELVLKNAVLYVAGNLIVTKGLTGRGTVFVEGSVIIAGPTNLVPSDSQAIALAAQGTIELSGGKGARF